MPREKFQTLTEQMFYILLCGKNMNGCKSSCATTSAA